MSGLKLSFFPLAFYLFLLGLSFFFASTLGGVFTGVFSLLFFFLVLDLMQLLVSSNQVFISEQISADHVIKGQTLNYSLHLEAGILPLRSSRIDMEISWESGVKRDTFWMSPGEKKKVSRNVTCRFRGVYTLGLTSLEIRSWTGWIVWSQDLWPRTFYVLPRVIQPRNLSWITHQAGSGHTSKLTDLSPPSLFDHVVPYREGTPLKYLDWKPVARGLDPVVRNFLPETWDLVSLFLDMGRLREQEEVNDDLLHSEDLCVETAASLLYGLLAQSVPGICWTYSGSSGVLSQDRGFQSWLESTISWEFHTMPSLAVQLRSSELLLQSRGAVFITQRPDPELWQLLLQLQGERTLINILRCWSEAELKIWRDWGSLLERQGCRVLEIRELDDLERSLYG